MNLRFLAVAAVMFGGLALVACERHDCGGGAVDGCGTAGSHTGGKGTTTDTGTGGKGSTTISCFACACELLLSEDGCKDVCDKDASGKPDTPNFCDGAPPLTECAECMLNRCGEPDPTACQ